jgi:hypothetical protein
MLLVVVAVMTGGVLAQSATDREAAIFDHPTTVQRVPAKSPADAVGEIK